MTPDRLVPLVWNPEVYDIDAPPGYLMVLESKPHAVFGARRICASLGLRAGGLGLGGTARDDPCPAVHDHRTRRFNSTSTVMSSVPVITLFRLLSLFSVTPEQGIKGSRAVICVR
jgi:hypothetical protein